MQLAARIVSFPVAAQRAWPLLRHCINGAFVATATTFANIGPATGATVALLQQHGIRVFAASQIAEPAAEIEARIQQVRHTVKSNV